MVKTGLSLVDLAILAALPTPAAVQAIFLQQESSLECTLTGFGPLGNEKTKTSLGHAEVETWKQHLLIIPSSQSSRLVLVTGWVVEDCLGGRWRRKFTRLPSILYVYICIYTQSL